MLVSCGHGTQHTRHIWPEFASNWGLLAGYVICAALFICLKSKDYVDAKENVVGTDEKLENVMAVGTEMRERGG